MKTYALCISGAGLLLALSSCALFDEEPVVREPTEREKLFARAEQAWSSQDAETAQAIYFRLTRNSDTAYDPIYDQSLWRLVKLYEKQDQSEKALLSLDELAKRPQVSLSKNKIRFAQMKNHFRVTNYYQAREVKKQIDEAYRNQELSLDELREDLLETTDLAYDRHAPDELMFLGEVQKYFIFIMESPEAEAAAQVTDRLIICYDGFFNLMARSSISADLKKQLAVSLLDQLRKFDGYRVSGSGEQNPHLTRFGAYSEKKQKQLTESLIR